MTEVEDTTHLNLDCGIELGVAAMPSRRVVSMELRVLAGFAQEPADKLGLARLTTEVIDKGTAKRDGRALHDAFDELGASRDSWTGREAAMFTCVCLPEFVDRVIELHAEFLRSPTFPDDAVETALALTDQEISALEDDPPSLADKLISRQALGPVLGRHPLGEREALAQITRDDLVKHWQNVFGSGRMQVSVAGPVEPQAVAATLERCFAGFGDAGRRGRDVIDFTFAPDRSHYPKDVEQEQIAICFPSAAVTDDDFHVERVLRGVFAGGMSSRLFTEVREKQGLAYDVHAASENPRGHGLMFVSASCKLERADTAFQTILREINRLSQDLTEDEVDLARSRLIARDTALADQTRSRRQLLAFDLFHYGHPVPIEERLAKIKSVTVDDLLRYLEAHPRDRLSILTLGPKECGTGFQPV